jgi:hypothetical protein
MLTGRDVRKIVLAGSLILSVVALVAGFNYQLKLCSDIYSGCIEDLLVIGSRLFVFVPIFIFSLITYFMRKEVYKIWLIWSVIWGAGFSYLVYLAGDSRGSGAGMSGGYEGLVIVILLGLYPIVSIILILTKYWLLARSKK